MLIEIQLGFSVTIVVEKKQGNDQLEQDKQNENHWLSTRAREWTQSGSLHNNDAIGPLQLGSRDNNCPKNIVYYGLLFKECQDWKKHIENTKMVMFEVPSIKE